MELKKNKNGVVIGYKEKVYMPDGSTITKTFQRKTDAINWKRENESSKRKNALLGAHGLKEDLYFKDLYEQWFNKKIEPAKEPKTIADYRSICHKHLIPLFGNTKVRSIKRSHGDELIVQLRRDGLANKTSNKIIAVFKQIMTYAEIEEYCVKSPLRHFSMLKANNGRVDFLSKQEVIQLLRANVNQAIYPLLVVALNTGMRIGEIAGLCWDRLNFDTDTIEVSRTFTRSGLKNSTKTNLVRYIPMNTDVKEIFRQLMKFQKCPRYVFVNKEGQPYNPDHFSGRYFQRALDRAGVRRINFHVLRHTYASHFMMNGGNAYDLQKILGHTKFEMTTKYAHLSPQHLRKAIETVRFSATEIEDAKSSSPFLAPRDKSRDNYHANFA